MPKRVLPVHIYRYLKRMIDQQKKGGSTYNPDQNGASTTPPSSNIDLTGTDLETYLGSHNDGFCSLALCGLSAQLVVECMGQVLSQAMVGVVCLDIWAV